MCSPLTAMREPPFRCVEVERPRFYGRAGLHSSGSLARTGRVREERQHARPPVAILVALDAHVPLLHAPEHDGVEAVGVQPVHGAGCEIGRGVTAGVTSPWLLAGRASRVQLELR